MTTQEHVWEPTSRLRAGGDVGHRPGPPAEVVSRGRTGDVVVGVVFGVLAGSNLVQGTWSAHLPWLNLTSAAFGLAFPIALTGLRREAALRTVAAGLLLLAAIALGFLEPPLSAVAEHKRVNIVVGVAFVFVAACLSLSNVRRLKVFLVTLVCLALPIVVGQVLAPDAPALATGRRTPVGVNAIGAGRAMGAAFVLATALLVQRSRGTRRMVLLLLALVLGLGLVWSGSRGPVLGAVVAVLVLLWKHPRLRAPTKVGLCVLLTTLAGLAYETLASRGSRLADQTTSGRDELYRQAVRVAVEHPLGVGWGNFFRFAPGSLVGTAQGDTLYAHNIVLEFWIEAGVVGGVAFVVMLLVTLARVARLASGSAVGLALAALTLDLLVGAMLSSDIVGNRMMWVVLAAVLTVGPQLGSATAVVSESRPARPTGRRRSTTLSRARRW